MAKFSGKQRRMVLALCVKWWSRWHMKKIMQSLQFPKVPSCPISGECLLEDYVSVDLQLTPSLSWWAPFSRKLGFAHQTVRECCTRHHGNQKLCLPKDIPTLSAFVASLSDFTSPAQIHARANTHTHAQTRRACALARAHRLHITTQTRARTNTHK